MTTQSLKHRHQSIGLTAALLTVFVLCLAVFAHLHPGQPAASAQCGPAIAGCTVSTDAGVSRSRG